MIVAMVDNSCRCDLALALAHDAQRVLPEVSVPIVAPAPTVEVTVLLGLIGATVHDTSRKEPASGFLRAGSDFLSVYF